MDKRAVLEIIRKFKVLLENGGMQVEKIILFGSYANGNPHEWSDIDLVVVSPDFENVGLWERIKMISKAICEIFEPIEAIPMTPEEWERGDSMICEFAKRGEVIS
jgi:predicted nucleotidyltransferase